MVAMVRQSRIRLLPPAREKDPLTGFYPGGFLDAMARASIRHAHQADVLIACPNCGEMVALALRTRSPLD